MEFMAKRDCAEMEQMDCYVAVRGSENVAELSDVPAENMRMYELYYRKPVHTDIRVPKTRWVVLRYPNDAMAQLSGTSRESFEDFYFEVCNLDYSKMEEAMKPLVNLMEKTDKVRLVSGSGTDLTFSIKDIPVIPCAGHMNIPDGEVYTAPVKNSVNGVICYNTPSMYQGYTKEVEKLIEVEKEKEVEKQRLPLSAWVKAIAFLFPFPLLLIIGLALILFGYQTCGKGLCKWTLLGWLFYFILLMFCEIFL